MATSAPIEVKAGFLTFAGTSILGANQAGVEANNALIGSSGAYVANLASITDAPAGFAGEGKAQSYEMPAGSNEYRVLLEQLSDGQEASNNWNGTAWSGWVVTGGAAAGPDETIPNAGALTGAAPAGAKWGIDTTNGQTYYVVAGNWTASPASTIDRNLTISDRSGNNGAGNLVPDDPSSNAVPDIGDVLKEIYDDVEIYFQATAANWTSPARTQVAKGGAAHFNPDGTLAAGATTPAADSDAAGSIAGLAAGGALQRRHIDSVRMLVGAGAPTNGTTVAWYVGQWFHDAVADVVYRADAASTDPDAAGTGSLWSPVSLGEARFQFTAGITNAAASEYWIITANHDFRFPANPANGVAVRTAPGNGDWNTLGATFTTTDTSTVASGQIGVVSGGDLVTWVYSQASDNWIAVLGDQPGLELYGGLLATVAILTAQPIAGLEEGKAYMINRELVGWQPAATAGKYEPDDKANKGVDPGYWVSISGGTVLEITADPAPAGVNVDYLATYAAAGPFTLPATAGLLPGDKGSLRNLDGTAITITPPAGASINGMAADETLLSDHADGLWNWVWDGTDFSVTKEALTVPQTLTFDRLFGNVSNPQGAPSPTDTFTPTRTGTYEYICELGTTNNEVYCSLGTAAGLSDLVNKDGDRLDDANPRTVDDVVLTSGTTYHMITGAGGSTGNSSIRVIIRLKNPVDYVALGTLPAESARDLIYTGASISDNTNANLTSLTWQQVVDTYEHIEVAAVFGNDVFTSSFDLNHLRTAGAANFINSYRNGVEYQIANVGLGDGQFNYFQAPVGTASSLRIYGIRKQKNAIRAEDAQLIELEGTLTAGANQTINAGQNIRSASAWIEFGGEWLGPQQDGFNDWFLRWNAAGDVQFSNRTGVFAGALPYRIVALA